MVQKPNGLIPILLIFFAVIAGMVSTVLLYDYHHAWWSVAPVILIPVGALGYWGWRCRNNSVTADDEEFIEAQALLRDLSESAGKTKDGLACSICGKELDLSAGALVCCDRWWDVRLVPGRGMCLVEVPPPGWLPEVGLDG